jgi:hypothetical protein
MTKAETCSHLTYSTPITGAILTISYTAYVAVCLKPWLCSVACDVMQKVIRRAFQQMVIGGSPRYAACPPAPTPSQV